MFCFGRVTARSSLTAALLGAKYSKPVGPYIEIVAGGRRFYWEVDPGALKRD